MILSILKQAAAISSTTKKRDFLKSHAGNETLKNVFRLAYNKSIVFGIKKFKTDHGFHYADKSLDYALEFIEKKLATRTLTGNEALEKLADVMKHLSAQDSEVIRRIILRDLECGASGGSANKVWKGLIKEQPCMKASACSVKTLAKIKYPAIAQLKADGTRCMIIKHNGIVSAWSRNGKEFIGITPIIKLIEDHPADNFVLDGELVYEFPVDKPAVPVASTDCDLSFLFGDTPTAEPEVELSVAKDYNVANRQTGNGIVSKAMKGSITPEEAENVVFQVWDYIEVEDYWNGIFNVTYKGRLERTNEIVDQIGSKKIVVVETEIVNSLAEAKALYQKYIDLGLEGIILKNILGIWKDSRSADQVKFKEIIDIDMICVGYYAHIKDENKLGGITVRSRCGMIQNNAGSGLTDTTHDKNGVYIELGDRDDLDREKLMALAKAGKLDNVVFELQCNGILESKNRKSHEAPYKLFLGVIKKVRFDKSPEDANSMAEAFPDFHKAVFGDTIVWAPSKIDS